MPHQRDNTAVDISVVVPFYNENANVDSLYHAVREALEATSWNGELVLVDDGSSDDTLARLVALQQQDSRLRVIELRRNFGQTVAMRQGILAARGRVIVTMDGDLQNDPRDIPGLIARIDEGYDLVAGWRRDRKDPWLSRKLPSSIANRLIGKITGIPVHDNGCSLKAYRRELIRRVPLYAEMHRFIPAMSTTAGAAISEVVVRHHPRRHGASKYGLSRIGKVLLDVFAIKMLITCVERPMHWFFGMAVPFVLFSICLTIWWALLWSIHAPTRASVVIPTALLLLAYLVIHFAFVGFLAELVVKLRRPGHVRPTRQIDYFTRTK